MSKQTIRTKWHHVVDLLDKKEVYFIAMEGGKAIYADADEWMNELFLREEIGRMNDLPKFVFDHDLFKAANTEALHQTILDMQRCGVLRLPYPQVLFEMRFKLEDEKRPYHSIVCLTEEQTEGGVKFIGYPFRIHSDDDGEYLIIAPGSYGITVQNRDGVPWLGITTAVIDELVKHKGRIVFADLENQLATSHFREAPAISVISELAQRTARKASTDVWIAIFCMTVLLSTRGLKREGIDATKLNRHRIGGKEPKAPIPHHTYISIGHVYRGPTGDASDVYIPGRSPIPHWRRGHIARWRTGPLSMLNRGWGEKFVEARMVSLAEDAIVPPPDYRVKQ